MCVRFSVHNSLKLKILMFDEEFVIYAFLTVPFHSKNLQQNNAVMNILAPITR